MGVKGTFIIEKQKLQLQQDTEMVVKQNITCHNDAHFVHVKFIGATIPVIIPADFLSGARRSIAVTPTTLGHLMLRTSPMIHMSMVLFWC